MVKASEKMDDEWWNADDFLNYRTFLFNFANTFFREICSLFVTFLTKRQPETSPLQVGGQSDWGLSNNDEFVQHMETVLFGGMMKYYHDPARGRSQVRPHNHLLQEPATGC